jgi:hypothetical protein
MEQSQNTNFETPDIIATIQLEASNYILQHKKVPWVALSKQEYKRFKEANKVPTVLFNGEMVKIPVRRIS